MVQEERRESGSLTERLAKIEEVIDSGNNKKKKEKVVKFKRISNAKLKNNYVLVILLKTNKQVEARVLPIKDNLIYLKDNETFHIASTDFVMRYKKLPMIILPEWDLKPLSVDELMGKAIQDKSLAFPQKIIIQAMKQAQLMPKKKGISVGLVIGIILAIAGVVVISQLIKKKA